MVFEHGFLISKLGRNNVCALVKDDIEKPNDISGVLELYYILRVIKVTKKIVLRR